MRDLAGAARFGDEITAAEKNALMAALIEGVRTAVNAHADADNEGARLRRTRG